MAIYRFINGRLEIKPTSRVAALPVAGTRAADPAERKSSWQLSEDRIDLWSRKAS